jgi:Caspase domain
MNARAIIIAINEYPKEASQKNVLAGAVDDALDFAEWALDLSDGGGQVAPGNLHFWAYPVPAVPENLQFLVTPDRPWPVVPRPDLTAHPKSADIARLIRGVADAAANSGEDERLYVYFAGHGVMTPRQGHKVDAQNCFVAGDYQPGDTYGLVPLDDIRRFLEVRGPIESLVISDCCRNELPFTVVGPQLQIDVYDDLAINKQWLVGRAAKTGEIAFETPHEKPARGAFTKMLVQALRQYRIDGALSLPELQGFVRGGVKELVKPKVQVPTFAVRDDEEPYVVVAGPPIGPPPVLTVMFPPEIVGDVIILDRRDKPVTDRLPIIDDRIKVALPPGQYTVDHEASGRDKSVFHFGPEETRVDF